MLPVQSFMDHMMFKLLDVAGGHVDFDQGNGVDDNFRPQTWMTKWRLKRTGKLANLLLVTSRRDAAHTKSWRFISSFFFGLAVCVWCDKILKQANFDQSAEREGWRKCSLLIVRLFSRLWNQMDESRVDSVDSRIFQFFVSCVWFFSMIRFVSWTFWVNCLICGESQAHVLLCRVSVSFFVI